MADRAIKKEDGGRAEAASSSQRPESTAATPCMPEQEGRMGAAGPCRPSRAVPQEAPAEPFSFAALYRCKEAQPCPPLPPSLLPWAHFRRPGSQLLQASREDLGEDDSVWMVETGPKSFGPQPPVLDLGTLSLPLDVSRTNLPALQQILQQGKRGLSALQFVIVPLASKLHSGVHILLRSNKSAAVGMPSQVDRRLGVAPCQSRDLAELLPSLSLLTEDFVHVQWGLAGVLESEPNDAEEYEEPKPLVTKAKSKGYGQYKHQMALQQQHRMLVAAAEAAALDKGPKAKGQDKGKDKKRAHTEDESLPQVVLRVRIRARTMSGVCKALKDLVPQVLQLMMSHGQGLYLGPDSDGLLNYCDVGRAALSAEAAAGPSSGRSSAGPSPSKKAKHSKRATAAAAAPATERITSLPSGIKDIATLFSSISIVAERFSMPEATPPGGMLTTPRKFQLQGLEWMVRREQRGDACNRGVLSLHPAWVQLVTEQGQVFYVRRADGHMSPRFEPSPPQGTCGGFLCDEMGLGKTLQPNTLRCGIYQKYNPKGAADPAPAPAAGKRAKGSIDVGPKPLPVLLCEDVFSSSSGSGRSSAAAGTSKAGGKRTIAMHECDVVIMSYEVLQKELSGTGHSPLKDYGFWRLMLDEAQNVAKTNSKAAQVASDLLRRNAWVVTGTPITKSLEELRGLCNFLALQPYMQPGTWESLMEGPLRRLCPAGLLSSWSMLRGVMLRRTKQHVEEQLGLPPCTWEDRKVELSPLERHIYQEQCAQLIEKIEGIGGVEAAEKGAEATKGELRSLFERLRQACCHPQLVRSQDELFGEQRLGLSEIMDKLVKQAHRHCSDALLKLWSHRATALMRQGDKRKQQGGQTGGGVDGAAAVDAELQRMDEELELVVELVSSASGSEGAQAKCWRANGSLDVPAARALLQALAAADTGAGPSSSSAACGSPQRPNIAALPDQLPITQPEVLTLLSLAAAGKEDGALEGGLEWPPARWVTVKGKGKKHGQGAAQGAPAVDEHERQRQLRHVAEFTSLQCCRTLGIRPKQDDGKDDDTPKWWTAMYSKYALEGLERRIKSGTGAGGGPMGADAQVVDDRHLKTEVLQALAPPSLDLQALRKLRLSWRVLQERVVAGRLQAALQPLCSSGAPAQAAEGDQPQSQSQQGQLEQPAFGAGGQLQAAPDVERVLEQLVGSAWKVLHKCEAECDASVLRLPLSERLERMAGDSAVWQGIKPKGLGCWGQLGRTKRNFLRRLALRVALLREELRALKLLVGDVKLAVRLISRCVLEAQDARRLLSKVHIIDGSFYMERRALCALDSCRRIPPLQQPLMDWVNKQVHKQLRANSDSDAAGFAAMLPRGGLMAATAEAGVRAVAVAALSTAHALAAVPSKGQRKKDKGAGAELDAAGGSKAAGKRGSEALGTGQPGDVGEEELEAEEGEMEEREESRREQRAGASTGAQGSAAGGKQEDKEEDDFSGYDTEDYEDEEEQAQERPEALQAAASSLLRKLVHQAGKKEELLAASSSGAGAASSFHCPICLEPPVEGRLTITSCGHTFCSPCVNDLMKKHMLHHQPHHHGHPQPHFPGMPCPICRTLLQPSSLLQTASRGEAAMREAQRKSSVRLEWGAKVSALLAELQRAESERPGFKVLVLSAWERMLGFAASALEQEGWKLAALRTKDTPEERQAQLEMFRNDPGCRVLLLPLVHASGAAGLTLTQAQAVYLLEPSLDPALEAQAAARVHRMGQTVATRIVRFVTSDSIEQAVLELQATKPSSGLQLVTKAAAAGGSGSKGRAKANTAAEEAQAEFHDITRVLRSLMKSGAPVAGPGSA